MGQVNANHLAAQTGGGTLQGANHFALEIEIEGWDNVVLALDSSNAPTETSEEIEVKYGNETRKYAGGVTYENMTLTVRDFVDLNVLEILENWRNSTYDPETGAVGYPSEYKKSGHFVLFDSKGNTVKRWKLVGVWCSNLNRGQVSMDDSNPVKIEATICIDKVFRPELTLI